MMDEIEDHLTFKKHIIFRVIIIFPPVFFLFLFQYFHFVIFENANSFQDDQQKQYND
jgi:hypothetical protein